MTMQVPGSPVAGSVDSRQSLSSITGSVADPGLKRELKFGLGAGAVVLWLILAYVAISEATIDRGRAVQSLKSEAALQTEGKAEELTALFRELYIVTRTVSLLPAIRHATPQNRPSAEDNVVDGKRFQEADAQTVQQLYNHAASIASVSEIYVVYEGFDPDRGQVPFLMFDDVIVDKIHAAHASHAGSEDTSQDPADIPIEDESEEYAYLSKLLGQFRAQYPHLPVTAPAGIALDISPLMVTCDNTQYLSKREGNPYDRKGLILSVPVYSDKDHRFEGLIATIVRANILEARLLGWPFIPITDAEEREAVLEGVKLDTPPADYVLENEAAGIRIYDRRNTLIPKYLEGDIKPAMELEYPVDASDSQWRLRRFVPEAAVDAENAAVTSKLFQRLLSNTMLIIVLGGGLWLILQRRVTDDLEHIASHDSLTGLPNRRELTRRISLALKTATENQQHLALVMVDLDDFKRINDTIGHAAGDQLLAEVAHRFEDILRSTDVVERLYPGRETDPEPVVGRLGGDEFLVLLPNVGGPEQALMVTERLIAGLTPPILLEGQSTYCHASMGIALFPIHSDDADVLLRRADSAMYTAKRVRGSSVAVFDQKLSTASVRHLQLLNDLHIALVEQQLVLYYQPIVDIASGRIHEVEALLRWQHPEYGLVSPAEFIPLLEQTGLIVDVGEWVLRRVCQQLLYWKRTGSPIDHAAVNVSVVQLSQSDFTGAVMAILAEERTAPESITVEITESVLMENPEGHLQQLKKLREAGVRLALDDFGTGHSSLSYLRQLPVSALKIDRSLVADSDNRASRSILFALCELARRMEIRCIGEGVETAEQYRVLVEAGCDAIQGWIIGMPQPVDQIDRLIAAFDVKAVGSGIGPRRQSG